MLYFYIILTEFDTGAMGGRELLVGEGNIRLEAPQSRFSAS